MEHGALRGHPAPRRIRPRLADDRGADAGRRIRAARVSLNKREGHGVRLQRAELALDGRP